MGQTEVLGESRLNGRWKQIQYRAQEGKKMEEAEL